MQAPTHDAKNAQPDGNGNFHGKKLQHTASVTALLSPFRCPIRDPRPGNDSSACANIAARLNVGHRARGCRIKILSVDRVLVHARAPGHAETRTACQPVYQLQRGVCTTLHPHIHILIFAAERVECLGYTRVFVFA